MAELGGEPQATVIGLPQALPAPNAAFANAMLCHGLDFDDTHSDSIAHVAVVTCPVAAAAAEAEGAGGRELLTAIVAGNEVVTRVGMAASGPYMRAAFTRRRSAASSAASPPPRHTGAPVDRAASALGIAGSFAGGLFAYLDDATPTKPLHPAWAAHGALLATRLAVLGAEGPPGVLEGRFGVYHAFVGAERRGRHRDAADRPRSALGDAADRVQAVPRLPFHPRLARRRRTLLDGLDADEIEETSSRSPRQASRSCWSRRPPKAAPRSEYEAKFSLQYSTAAMLVHGRVGVADLQRRGDRRPARARAGGEGAPRAARVPSYPAAFPGGVRITTRTGARSRPTSPTSGAAREPDGARRGAGEVPAERFPRARRRRSRRSRTRCSGSTSAATSRGLNGRRRRRGRRMIDRREHRGRRQPFASGSTARSCLSRRSYEHADEFPRPSSSRCGARPLRRDDPRGVRRARARRSTPTR